MTMLSAFLSFGSAGQPHYDRPPARPRQCPATPRRSNHPPAAARPTLSSSDLPAVHHACESALRAPNSCMLSLHRSRARRRRVSGRPAGRSMFLEHPFHASIWHTRRRSLLPLNTRADRGPGDRRHVESPPHSDHPRDPATVRRTQPFPVHFFSHDPGASARTLPRRPRNGAAGSAPRGRRCRMKDRRVTRFRASPALGRFGGISGNVAQCLRYLRQVRRGQRRPAVSSGRHG